MFQSFLGSLKSHTELIHITKSLHSGSNHWISVICLVRKVLNVYSSIEVAWIVNLNPVTVLIEMYRRIGSLETTVHDGVHHNLSHSPIRIIDFHILSHHRHIYRTLIFDGVMYEHVNIL